MTYSEAARKIVADYKKRISDYNIRELELMESNEQFRNSEATLRDLTLKQAKGEKIEAKKLKAASEQNSKLRKQLLLTPPSPRCDKCGDTGRTGGRFCECAIKLALSTSGEVGIPLHDFENVDFSVYGSDKESQQKLFEGVKKICDTYPSKKFCLVISGSTGNGKTYLAGCAANRMLNRGASVMALTAFAANNRFLKYHTCFDDNKSAYLDEMLDCTFLIIDDLGTESILKNVTAQYLYQVINERNLNKKLTMITTNLTPDKILERYGERVYSRLFDKSLSFATYINVKDIRSAL